MTKDYEFFIYLLEQYARIKGTSGDKVLKQLDDLGLTETVVGLYAKYGEDLESAYKNVDKLIAEKQTKRTSN